VKFSIFCIDSDTKPYNPKLASVVIKNPDGITIRKFNNVTFVKGKYVGYVKPKDIDVFGSWAIIVDAEGQVS
jgi:hypothetical protein